MAPCRSQVSSRRFAYVKRVRRAGHGLWRSERVGCRAKDSAESGQRLNDEPSRSAKSSQIVVIRREAVSEILHSSADIVDFRLQVTLQPRFSYQK